MTTPIPAETLREWREACERATPGPISRYWCNLGGRYPLITDDENEIGNIIRAEDGDFISVAYTALPRLLDAYEASQREIAALRERLEECRCQLRDMSNVFFNLKQGATMREGDAERYQHGCERIAAKAIDAIRAQEHEAKP